MTKLVCQDLPHVGFPVRWGGTREDNVEFRSAELGKKDIAGVRPPLPARERRKVASVARCTHSKVTPTSTLFHTSATMASSIVVVINDVSVGHNIKEHNNKHMTALKLNALSHCSLDKIKLTRLHY